MESRSRPALIRRLGARGSDGVPYCLPAPRRVVNRRHRSRLFEAYLECSTKCWLRSRAEPATGNFYAEWAHLQNECSKASKAAEYLRSLALVEPTEIAARRSAVRLPCNA